jgi:hypothetical protein
MSKNTTKSSRVNFSISSDDLEDPMDRFNKKTKNPYLAWLNPVRYMKETITKLKQKEK